MKTGFAALLCVVSFAGCATTDEGELTGELEVRAAGDATVRGTDFKCSAHDSKVLTPCYVNSERPTRGTAAWSREPGLIDLGLTRSTTELDGTLSQLVITLRYADAGGPPTVAAEHQTIALTGGDDPLPALGGWVQPVDTSPTLDGRNAGRFSLRFAWGTVSGTYDSADEIH